MVDGIVKDCLKSRQTEEITNIHSTIATLVYLPLIS